VVLTTILVVQASRQHHAKRNVRGGGQLKWPELVGLPGLQAKAAILREYPDLDVQIWDHNSPGRLSKDYHMNRVKIITDKNGNVLSVPAIG